MIYVYTLYYFVTFIDFKYIETSNGSGTLILSELDLTFIKNHNIPVLPICWKLRIYWMFWKLLIFSNSEFFWYFEILFFFEIFKLFENLDYLKNFEIFKNFEFFENFEIVNILNFLNILNLLKFFWFKFWIFWKIWFF